jgi:hypothetical protein
MGRFIDLCTEVATAAEEGGEGLVLSPEAWDRFREEFGDDEIEDALKIVQENLIQEELVDATDSLSASLVEILSPYGSDQGFAEAQRDGVALTLGEVAHLARRVARLEDILSGYRDGAPPDRKGLDALTRRLLDHGIESEMGSDSTDS